MLAAMTLELGDLAAIGGMIGGMTGVLLTLIVFHGKSMARRVEVVETRIDAVNDAVGKRIDTIAADKVSHKDWIRVVASQQNRLDRVDRTLAEVSGKLDATIGIAGGLKRIGDAIERQAQEHGR